MWAFIFFVYLQLLQSIFILKRNKIYDSNENLNNEALAQYDKLDRAFIIMLLVTLGLFGLSTYVLGWFDF